MRREDSETRPTPIPAQLQLALENYHIAS
jgi:enediyne biosynthesis thioesterase